MRTRALVPVLATACLCASFAEAAEPVPSLDLRGFHAPTDAASGLYLEPASSPGTFDWNVGLWAHYVHRPITLRDEANDVTFDVIKHQVTGDLTFNMGFAERVALGVDLPFVLFQTGDDPTPTSTAVLGETAIPRQALGDLGLDGKLTLIQPTGGEFGGFALALSERFTLPTGDDASFLGEGHITSETRLLAEYRLVALSVHLALGVKFRAEKESFACEGLSDEDCETRFGHELPFGFGLSVKPQAFGIDEKGRWTFFAETHGYLPISPASPFSDKRLAEAQVGLGARYAFARDLSLLGGVETAMLGGIGNPALRGTLSIAWAPRVHDSDDDGVEDEVDQCRELPEDKDGFQDDDGCPELDNDDDGVPDPDDHCATEKEDEDGFDDDDGCPDPDNDRDGVLDANDACPNEAGVKTDDPKTNGCTVKDPDADGIQGELDKCPDKAEDKDGFEDQDGCPDPDNDGDGINDADDKCPDVKGIDSPDPKEKGCPDADADKDTFLGAEDKCPDKAEVYNGIDDADGCPDEDPKKKAKPLVVVREKKDVGPVVEMSAAVAFTKEGEVDPASLPLLRALAAEVMARPGATVNVGVRPSKAKPDEAAAKAKAIALALRRFTRKDASAEAVPWATVKGAPNAEPHGIGFVILAPAAAKVAGTPEAPKAGEPAAPKTEAKPKAAAAPAAPKTDAKPATPKPKAEAPKGEAKPKAEAKPKGEAKPKADDKPKKK